MSALESKMDKVAMMLELTLMQLSVVKGKIDSGMGPFVYLFGVPYVFQFDLHFAEYYTESYRNFAALEVKNDIIRTYFDEKELSLFLYWRRKDFSTHPERRTFSPE